MKYLLLVLLLSSCAPLVPDKVQVEHSVNVALVEPYIRAYCESQYSVEHDIVECVELEIGKLINKL